MYIYIYIYIHTCIHIYIYRFLVLVVLKDAIIRVIRLLEVCTWDLYIRLYNRNLDLEVEGFSSAKVCSNGSNSSNPLKP